MAQTGLVVSGVVEDQTGAVIPSARVALTSRTARDARQATSDQTGRFTFKNVPAGQYLLTTAAEDFRSVSTTIDLGRQSVDIRVQMKITTEEQVTVTGAQPDPVAPDNNAASLRVNEELLRGLPTASQNILPLLNIFASPAASGTEGLSVVVDGIEADQVDDLPASAIKRIAIDKNPYSVEFRRPGKARVEVTTKEGSLKHYHGSIALFARDSLFDSKNSFASVKPDLSRKLFEGSFGGPLSKTASFVSVFQHLADSERAIINARTLAGPVAENVPTTAIRTDFLGRLDLHVGAAQTITALYGFDDRSDTNREVGGFNLPERGANGTQRGHKIQFTDQAVVSSNLLNTLQLLVRRQSLRSGTFPTAPSVVVNGAFASGPSQTSTQNKETDLEAQDVAIYSRGRHTLRFGGSGRTRLIDAVNASNFGGTFEFSSLDQFALGTPYLFRVNQGRPDIAFHIIEVSGLLQDEFRAHPNLSLVFGLRYDWQSSIGDARGVAPRAAFAYSPGGSKFVIRGGAGIFYERLPEAAIQRALLFDGVRGWELFMPNPSYPNPFTASPTNLLPSVVRKAAGLSMPFVLQTSFGIERELWKNTHFTAEYQRLRGVNLLRSRNINAPLPLTGQRPDASFLNIDQFESSAMMRSNALTLSFRGRVGKSLNVTSQYTFSRTLNDTSGAFSLPANNYDLRPELGRMDFDRRHRFNLAGVVNLPRGFRVGSLLTLGTGVPFDITTGFDDNNDTIAKDRPLGVTRNQGQGPGLAQLDLRLTKLLRVPRLVNRDSSSRNLEISVDTFNVLNRINFVNFVGVRTSPFFGKANSALPARTMQLSLRYRF